MAYLTGRGVHNHLTCVAKTPFTEPRSVMVNVPLVPIYLITACLRDTCAHGGKVAKKQLYSIAYRNSYTV